MWEAPDTIGLISCIVGTILFLIPLPTIFAIYIWIFGGSGVLAMGIVAVVKDSKIGIGGIIIGAITILAGIFTLILALLF
jgi:hypothetical protein